LHVFAPLIREQRALLALPCSELVCERAAALLDFVELVAVDALERLDVFSELLLERGQLRDLGELAVKRRGILELRAPFALHVADQTLDGFQLLLLHRALADLFFRPKTMLPEAAFSHKGQPV